MITDPKTIGLRVGVYIFFYLVVWLFAAQALLWLGGYFVGATMSGLLGAWLANWLSMRIYERRPFAQIGLGLTPDSGRNLLLGLAGGIGSAALVLSLPLASGAALLVPSPDPTASWNSDIFVVALLLGGSAGEEILFRGYGPQILIRLLGPYATILPIGVLFAAMHSGNPHSTWLALVNTAGFGILFGYAFLRSHDIWLPIGLHFGWNLTLPLFGVNVSGFTMKLTGYTVQWNAGPLWSGGEYGPEASVLTSGALIALFVYLWKAPVRRQYAPLIDSSNGN